MNHSAPMPPDHDSSLDPALDQTRRTLRRLHAEQQPRPDDAFVRRLERSLMQQSSTVPARSPGIRHQIDRLSDGVWLRGPRARHRAWSISALSLAVLLALVAGSLAAVLRFGETGSDEPSRTAMFAPSGTPAVTAAPTEQTPGLLWSHAFDEAERFDVTGVALANGTIYRLLASPAYLGIEAIDAATGTVRWSRETNWFTGSMTPGTAGANPIAADEERIYIFGAPQQVHALDAETGELVWSNDIGGVGLTLQVHNGEIIVWNDSNLVTALDAATGDDNWSVGAPESRRGTYTAHAPFVTDELVLAVFGPGDLTAISRELGDVLWGYDDTFDPMNVWVADVDGTIILQGSHWKTGDLDTPRQNIVAALDAADGAVIWRQEIASSPVTNIAVSGGSLFIIADNPETAEATSIAMASPAPERAGVMWPNVVQALDVATGAVIWTSEPVSSFYRQLFTLPDGTVLALTNDAELIGFSPESGDQVCSLYQLPDYPLSNVLIDETAIYLSLIDGTLLALDQAQLCSESTPPA